jgi:hypothetical protein
MKIVYLKDDKNRDSENEFTFHPTSLFVVNTIVKLISALEKETGKTKFDIVDVYSKFNQIEMPFDKLNKEQFVELLDAINKWSRFIIMQDNKIYLMLKTYFPCKN